MRAALSCTFEISRGGTEDGKAGAKVGNRSGCKKPDVTRYEKFQKACLLAIKTVHFSRSKLVGLKVIFFWGGVTVQASVARCLRTPPGPAKGLDLMFGLADCLRSHCYRCTIVICNCTF
jgi:hypothetical protein